jgi:3D (Asp-Asp-Asp) domain-containing protein
MRARQTLRAPGATRLFIGALVLTIAGAALALGSASAVARGGQRGSWTASGAPAKQPVAEPAKSRRPDIRRAAVSRLVVEHNPIVSPTGSTVSVHGVLRPGRRGAEIKLIARVGRGWRTLAIGRTDRRGRFRIRYRVQGVGATAVRVDFGGSRRARAASADAGQIVALAPTVASWYNDGGSTACGFHATYGVASRTLPCGTKVTLSFGGHTVVATVDDRGPYVYGRSFDLNQNTARSLGMWGVARVFASV